jgi:hypothetical protein
MRRTCTAPGCDKPLHAHGLCSMHDSRMRRHGELEPAGLAMRGASIEDQYRAKVDVRGPDECWPWLAFRCADGYGRFNRSPVGILAHRYGWFLANGPIPEGHVIDHICHDPATCTDGKQCPHRPCQNPAHMVPVPAAHNNSPERAHDPRTARTHCPQGHPYDEANTLWSTRRSTGKKFRQCRTCARERVARRAAEAREAGVPCSVDGCGKVAGPGPAGHCEMHKSRLLRTGRLDR